MTSTAAALLMDRLGLTEDELCAALDVDPLSVISGELAHKPQLPIRLTLTQEAAARVAREQGYAPEKWERWAAESATGERQATFIVESAAGMASCVIDTEDPAIAHLYAMWVAPDARGTGAGTALVEAVVAWAADRGA